MSNFDIENRTTYYVLRPTREFSNQEREFERWLVQTNTGKRLNWKSYMVRGEKALALVYLRWGQ